MSGMSTLRPKVERLVELAENYRNAIEYPNKINPLILPKGLTQIGEYAFYKRRYLSNLEMGNEVHTIGQYSFCGCDGLETLPLPNGLAVIKEHAFEGCKKLNLSALPETVTEIGEYAFQGCRALTLTKLPDGLKRISVQAFNGAGSGGGKLALTELPPNVEYIDEWALGWSPNIAISEIPASVISIGEYAFANDTGITGLIFMGTPTSIHANAFVGCSNLKYIHVPWEEGSVAGAPWGATNASITYNYGYQQMGYKITGIGETLNHIRCDAPVGAWSGQNGLFYQISSGGRAFSYATPKGLVGEGETEWFMYGRPNEEALIGGYIWCPNEPHVGIYEVPEEIR